MSIIYTLTAETVAGDIPCLSLARQGLPGDAPLLVVLHGLSGRKEHMLPILYEMVQLGGRVLAPDLHLHGERPDTDERGARLESDYFGATAEMITESARDVSRLLDHFRPTRAGIHGISLGGYTAFAALLAEPRLDAASVAMGSPDWLGPLVRAGLGPGHPTFDRAAALSPLDRAPQVFPPRPLLMLHGLMDEVVPPDGVIALEARLRPLYAAHPERLELRLYPELAHHYTDDMLARTAAFFGRFLLPQPED